MLSQEGNGGQQAPTLQSLLGDDVTFVDFWGSGLNTQQAATESGLELTIHVHFGHAATQDRAPDPPLARLDWAPRATHRFDQPGWLIRSSAGCTHLRQFDKMHQQLGAQLGAGCSAAVLGDRST